MRELSHNTLLAEDGKTRFQAWVSSTAEGEDPNIFIHEALPEEYSGADPKTRFSHVASSVDMRAYPVGTPAEGAFYFRTRQVDVLVDSPVVAGGFLDTIQSHISMLGQSEAMLSGSPRFTEEVEI